MSAAAAAQRLARIEAALRSGRLPDDKRDALWLADGIAAFRGGDGVSFDDCLGLRSAIGERSPRTSAALAMRDEIIRAAAVDYCGSQHAVARDLHIALSRYAATGWLQDRTREEGPKGNGNSRRAALYKILKAWPIVPSSERIRRVLRVGHEFAGCAPRLTASSNPSPVPTGKSA